MKYVNKAIGVICCDSQHQDQIQPPRHVYLKCNHHRNVCKSKSLGYYQTIQQKQTITNTNTNNLTFSQNLIMKEQNHQTQNINKKLLLIDLDKTIIFYSQQKGFIMRPYLRRFLVTLHKFYDIYIFTAATMSYLKDMLHRIEENKGGIQYISGYLTRQNCTIIQQCNQKFVYIKDIRVIKNYLPSQIVVVDDVPDSYLLNPDNAIPIIPFEGIVPDNHLLYLIQTLIEIKDYEDVRKYIRGRYIFKSSSSFSTDGFISQTSQSISLSPNKQSSSIKSIESQ